MGSGNKFFGKNNLAIFKEYNKKIYPPNHVQNTNKNNYIYLV